MSDLSYRAVMTEWSHKHRVCQRYPSHSKHCIKPPSSDYSSRFPSVSWVSQYKLLCPTAVQTVAHSHAAPSMWQAIKTAWRTETAVSEGGRSRGGQCQLGTCSPSTSPPSGSIACSEPFLDTRRSQSFQSHLNAHQQVSPPAWNLSDQLTDGKLKAIKEERLLSVALQG